MKPIDQATLDKKYLAIIPARFASTRFPGKPVALLGSKPVIEHVYTHVRACAELTDVIVATDDSRIYSAVNAFGGKAVMTRSDHRCGTDRCVEAMDKWLATHPDIRQEDLIVVNIQGDEPFVQPEQVIQLCHCFDQPDTDIATLARPFTTSDTFADLNNPNTPKVVFDARMRAILFSRSIIPYMRSIPQDEWLTRGDYYRHVGMYAYRADVLRKITALAPSPLELAESLEQLRWLENGYTIRLAITHTATIGIDTTEDLHKAEEILMKL